MSKWKLLIPAILLFAALPTVSQAQVSVPFAKATYRVQVQYEMWRNGSTYWSTVFTTDNQADAQLMHDLLDSALENGTICQILGCGFDWIIRDVRIDVEWEYYRFERLQYKSNLLYRYSP